MFSVSYPSPQGTFFRNGPGVFEIRGEPLHVFDGHGLVASIGIKDGAAHFRSRYVRTPVGGSSRTQSSCL